MSTNPKLQIKCQYCSSPATGINYKPKPQLDNAPACQDHTSNLFISFNQGSENFDDQLVNTQLKSESGTQNLNTNLNKRQVKNQEFFSELMNIIVGQFNLLKSETDRCEQKIKNFNIAQTEGFDLQCKITNPYMILHEDRDMMLNTFLTRIKRKFEYSRKQSNDLMKCGSLKNSICQNYRSPGINAHLKNSMMTDVSNRYNDVNTPISKTQFKSFRKSEGLKY